MLNDSIQLTNPHKKKIIKQSSISLLIISVDLRAPQNNAYKNRLTKCVLKLNFFSHSQQSPLSNMLRSVMCFREKEKTAKMDRLRGSSKKTTGHSNSIDALKMRLLKSFSASDKKRQWLTSTTKRNCVQVPECTISGRALKQV